MKILLGILIGLMIGGLAIGGYVYLNKPKLVSENTVVTPTNVPTVLPTLKPTEVPATPTLEDDKAIATAIKKLLVAEHGVDANDLVVSVKRIEGRSAQGSADEQGGGGMWFATKDSGEWKLVWDGNGIVSCKQMAPFPNFPKDMIPQCFDDATQNMVSR